MIGGGRYAARPTCREVRHDVVMDSAGGQYAHGIVCIVYVFAFGVSFVELNAQPAGRYTQ